MKSLLTDRREFLAVAAGAALGCSSGAESGPSAPGIPPIRRISAGPRFHWFGYYDKQQFDPTNRYVLGMEVDFEHRSPTPDDVIRIGMVDTAEGDKWIELGTSSAWGWQQGCMLQWVPGTSTKVIWNDRGADGFVSHTLDVESGEKRTFDSAIYAIAPDGKWAVTTDFRRLNDTRPGYGYAGFPDPNSDVLEPEDVGIWKLDLESGDRKLIFSVAAAAAVPNPHNETQGLKHYFNHLLVSPDGTRLIFLHRWRMPEGSRRRFNTRLFTIGSNGEDPYVLDPYGGTSHFIWRDPSHIMAWATHPSHGEKFYLYEDQTEHVEVVGPEVMPRNGHNTYLPGFNNEWVLNDTYPDSDRIQHVYLYHVPTGERFPIADLHSPPQYTGEWRCDNHPRSSRDGRTVCVDSPHSGGRQLHLIDISGIVG